MEIEQNVARRKRGVPEPLQHRADGRCPHCRTRLVNGGERHRKKTRVLDVVNSRQPHTARDAHTEFVERLEEMPCGEIVGANDTVGTMLCERRFQLLPILRLDPADARFEAAGRVGESLAISRDPRIDSGRGTRSANEHDPPATRADEMGRDDVARSVIIDANQIIPAPLRVRDQVAIEKNHGDAGSIERLRDAAIDRVLLRR